MCAQLHLRGSLWGRLASLAVWSTAGVRRRATGFSHSGEGCILISSFKCLIFFHQRMYRKLQAPLLLPWLDSSGLDGSSSDAITDFTLCQVERHSAAGPHTLGAPHLSWEFEAQHNEWEKQWTKNQSQYCGIGRTICFCLGQSLQGLCTSSFSQCLDFTTLV